ncbi:MAG: methyltransferase domain-containing protein [Lysobacteraceae bacterium]
MTIVMPLPQSVSASFSIAGYRDVDVAEDKSAYFAYLDRFFEASRAMTECGIDLLRLTPGGSVIDVGCGHGACASLLATRVGPSGRVVGIDSSQAMIAEAQRRFDRSGLPVEFQQGDALALPSADASFDAARCDRVFMFLDEPRKALAELVRVTRPGARIVVTEGDIGTHSIDASDVATTRALLAGLCDCSPNGWIGRRLRAMFVEMGLRDVDLRLIPIVSTSFAEWNHRLGVERFLSNAIADGSIAHDKGLAWIEELRTRDAEGLFTATAMLYMVVGTHGESAGA